MWRPKAHVLKSALESKNCMVSKLSLKVPYMVLQLPRPEPLKVQRPRINVFCFSGAVKAKV